MAGNRVPLQSDSRRLDPGVSMLRVLAPGRSSAGASYPFGLATLTKVTLAAMGLSVALATLIGFLWVALMGLDYGLARYPGSVRPARESLHLPAVAWGYLRQDSEFWASDEATRVRAWYIGRLAVEPGRGMYGEGGCERLSKVYPHFMIQHTVAVTVCVAERGTNIYLSQTVAVIPLAPATRR
jgi:hypothetical protein